MTSARNLAAAGVATLLAFGLLVGLGVWQLQRLAWKEALIARVTERMAADPVPLPPRGEWNTLDLDKWEYRRVVVSGLWWHAEQAFAYTVLSEPKGRYGGPGYFMMMPLSIDGGGTVILNLGFMPDSKADIKGSFGAKVLAHGLNTYTGVLRRPEDRNPFTPADDPAKRVFFARDPKAIADALQLKDAAPFTIDVDATAPTIDGLPQGGETLVNFPNRHLEYALTWFGLAGALAAVFGFFLSGARRHN